MPEKSGDTIRVSHEQAFAAKKDWMTHERLAALDAMADAQIASNPDVAPELTDEWFENARLVVPLKGHARAA